MANTTNYNWETPDDTDLVKDGAAAIRTLGNSVDTTTKALNPETTLGDIAYRSATSNTNTRLAIGSAGQVLTVAAGVPSWASPSDQTPLTTKGDVFTFSTVDARLGVGANGTVLTADSAEATGLKWAAPASGGITLITETVASALSSLSFTSISGSYKQLYLTWSGVRHSASGSQFAIRFNNTSGADDYLINGFQGQGASLNTNGTNQTHLGGLVSSAIYAFGENTNATAVYQLVCNGQLIIDNYASTTKSKNVKWNTSYYDNTNAVFSSVNTTSIYDSTSAITSIDIVRLTGSATFSNIGNSSIRLYGIN
jgi:hypothetical protein